MLLDVSPRCVALVGDVAHTLVVPHGLLIERWVSRPHNE